MIVALEFYVRTLNLRDNLPVPCSFCLESKQGDRKVVTLNEAYRRPALVAVRHWHLSDCAGEQTLPVLTERLVPRQAVFDSDYVVVPDHMIMGYHSQCIPSRFNFINKPMPEEIFSDLYTKLLKNDIHLWFKETWVWREFVKAYLPYMAGLIFDERDELVRFRSLMTTVKNSRPEIWSKWLRWRKYMIEFNGLPGEVAFCREYGSESFIFS